MRTEQWLFTELLLYLERYPKEMLRAFYDYWTEKDNKGAMRMNNKKHKYFEVGKRLATWNRNNNGKQITYNTDQRQRIIDELKNHIN